MLQRRAEEECGGFTLQQSPAKASVKESSAYPTRPTTRHYCTACEYWALLHNVSQPVCVQSTTMSTCPAAQQAQQEPCLLCFCSITLLSTSQGLKLRDEKSAKGKRKACAMVGLLPALIQSPCCTSSHFCCPPLSKHLLQDFCVPSDYNFAKDTDRSLWLLCCRDAQKEGASDADCKKQQWS